MGCKRREKSGEMTDPRFVSTSVQPFSSAVSRCPCCPNARVHVPHAAADSGVQQRTKVNSCTIRSTRRKRTRISQIYDGTSCHFTRICKDRFDLILQYTKK